MICVKWAQESLFSDDLRNLKTTQQVSTKSKLLSLSPFIDAEGIMRVGGRLKHSYLNYDTKHPIILPNKHILSMRVIEQYHSKYLHPTSSLLLNLLRQRFWIINGRIQVRQVTYKCITCYRQKATITKQLMGNLPASRVTPGRPFLQTGVDFAGPIMIRINKSRGPRSTVTKSYIALFICMATKAIHIELVSDLSTEAFIASLRRFTSRRGIPSDIFSDNGTNFIGAKSELSTLLKQSTNQQLINSFSLQNGIKWHFIPPLSPNFGGLWEAGVKSVKHHLNRITKDAILTSEEMNTLLIQIEALLNSRPITPMRHEDPANLDVLTPGHFLIGAPLTSVPSPNLEHLKLSRLSRWQLVQQMMHSFWHRWQLEYITTMQQRPKWQQPNNDSKLGDVVLLFDSKLPPTKWALGRIVDVHPGSDGLIRVVTIKTSTTELKRPVSKVAKLPIDEQFN